MFLTFCVVSFLAWELKAQLDPYVWPLPKEISVSTTPEEYIQYPFQITSNSDSQIIQEAINRYQYIIFPHDSANNIPDEDTVIKTLTITVSSNNENLQYGADESYSLSLPNEETGNAEITANTIWGALRGLETFSQLVIYNFTGDYYQAYTATIHDAPRFAWRGLLIDTSRHFQSLDSIRTVIDAMSYAKFNTLHWHIVDTQSFPYQSKAFPKLWKGAYTIYERYSQKDVAEIVSFAKSRGIRVIPEFDMPGHAQSWCIGYPQICPSSSCNTPLNPASNFTWELIEGLIVEAGKIFTDNWIHLGGDEVDTECWSATPSIVKWMDENGFNTPREALGYFDERVQSIGHYQANKSVINWVEVFNLFNNTLNPNLTTIEVWKSKNSLVDVVEAGFRGILADSDKWYLDHLDVTWETMYTNEPYEDIDTVEAQQLVLGGETCMWGETVDVSDIEQTIWPRAAAVAERLWSLREINSTVNAKPRYAYFRCLLNERGIAAAPFNNSVARSPPPHPGSCYDQR